MLANFQLSVYKSHQDPRTVRIHFSFFFRLNNFVIFLFFCILILRFEDKFHWVSQKKSTYRDLSSFIPKMHRSSLMIRCGIKGSLLRRRSLGSSRKARSKADNHLVYATFQMYKIHFINSRFRISLLKSHRESSLEAPSKRTTSGSRMAMP